MPPVVVAAGITAAGALGGAALASRSANKATKAQTESTNEALAYAKEQEAIRRADYERALAQWQAGRNALLQRYGVSVPEVSMPRPAQPPMAGQPAAVAPGGGPLNVRGNFVQNNPNLAALMASPQAPEGAPLVEPKAWNDWERYGLRSA